MNIFHAYSFLFAFSAGIATYSSIDRPLMLALIPFCLVGWALAVGFSLREAGKL